MTRTISAAKKINARMPLGTIHQPIQGIYHIVYAPSAEFGSCVYYMISLLGELIYQETYTNNALFYVLRC
jgi:hypothetical protein